MFYEVSDEPCPKCGGETYQYRVDLGVDVLNGPRGCTQCGWSEDDKYDLSDGRSAIDEKGGAIDQYGGYHPPGSTMAKAYRLAEGKSKKE